MRTALVLPPGNAGSGPAARCSYASGVVSTHGSIPAIGSGRCQDEIHWRACAGLQLMVHISVAAGAVPSPQDSGVVGAIAARSRQRHCREEWLPVCPLPTQRHTGWPREKSCPCSDSLACTCGQCGAPWQKAGQPSRCHPAQRPTCPTQRAARAPFCSRSRKHLNHSTNGMLPEV